MDFGPGRWAVFGRRQARSCFKSHEARRVGDHVGRPMHELARVGVLHDDPIDAAADAHFRRITHLITSHNRRPDRRESVERLAEQPLATVTLKLHVACTHVVRNGVPKNVARGLLPRDITAATPDDDNELNLRVSKRCVGHAGQASLQTSGRNLIAAQYLRVRQTQG